MCPQRKGIDGSRHTINGIGTDIIDAVGLAADAVEDRAAFPDDLEG